MANSESTVQIIPFYSHPHVHMVIKDNSWYDETTATTKVTNNLPYSVAIVSGADMGIDNTFVQLISLDTKNKLFGQSNYLKYGQPSIQTDVLFNGSTNVWFLRVLPDNARYANVIVLAHYRKGKILNDLGQETGKVRMEIKFSLAYANAPHVTDGAKSDNVIKAFAKSLASKKTDTQTGYMTVPICYIRSIGRGVYGNDYSVSITRDTDAENEYDMKMYDFNILTNKDATRVINVFAGSLYQTTRYNASTLIDDVMDQYATGSCPVSITSFEDSFLELYEFYKGIVRDNARYLGGYRSSVEDQDELTTAQAITEESFDPLFGILLNSRSGETIPYYRNYTVKETGEWKVPDLEVPNVAGATRPLNISNWSNAYVGARVLVVADPLHDGHRWLYNVESIDPDTGNIVYDEGEETEIDDDQYSGVNLSLAVGNLLDGGHDGDFQEITTGGETRPPSAAEMKLLLSREYVKAFRGMKDRRILSPMRIDLDFIFDANYNMNSDDLSIEYNMVPIYGNSTILTNEDAEQLAMIASGTSELDSADLNVKSAIYDLNRFRNRNGKQTMNEDDEGAGCFVYFDCGMIGLKSIGVNYELMSVINMMKNIKGRQCAIDLGHYEVFDPASRRRVKVTTSYFLAKNLIPHIVKYGINVPFVYNYAQLIAIQKDGEFTSSGNMIRDSFAPDIDLIDWDVKELLYKNRINYWLTTDEGRTVQRAVQNTRQTDASALLEENNVRILNVLKKNLEKACRGYMYKWNEPEVRKGFSNAQKDVYRPWIGTIVKDIDINFDANEWEQERMIMHCYVSVAFRDIIKRIILEININRPSYSSGGES